jgi:serine/threonine-protein kinase
MGQNFCPVCGTSLGGEAPDPLVGRVVADRYRIIALVGRGGMGVVYKCEHTRMGKIMAIKLLHGDLARDAEVQRRFRREAQAASRLSHPNTVSIFDFGTADGLMYLVMEYVSGEDLGKILRTAHHLPPTRVAAIAAQACGSLAEAHEKGIVHRDLKPENLLISALKDGRDFVKLLDFGLAKLREGEERNEITSAGTLVGTPYYMAPEIIRAQGVDHRADVYALGAVIYRAVTGTPAFTGQSPVAVLTRTLTDELVPPSRRRPELEIPAAIDGIVMRAMAREPADRYAQIDELRAALAEYLATEGLADSLLRESGLTARHVALGAGAEIKTESSRKLAVATRNDVEEFERGLRRGRIAGWVGLGVVLAVAAGAGAFVWRERSVLARRPHDSEVEPNNTPESATLIAPDGEVRGRIGARMTVDHGDVDYYRLLPLPAGDSNFRVELTPQPNIDTDVELLRVGRSEAVAIADDAPTGGREVLAGFRVSGDAQYYLSVHERIGGVTVPSENVTDWYTLRYTVSRIGAETETEPDDNEEIALALRVGQTVHGWIESHDDADWWCFDAQTGPITIRLTPPERLDVSLTIHPRDGTAESLVDLPPDHEAAVETATVPLPGTGGRPACVIVRGSQHRAPNAPGDGDHTYTLEAR